MQASVGSEQHPDFYNRQRQVEEMREILSRRLPAFYKAAYRHLGNAADAEDAVQDALLSAYKHLDQFRGQSQMSTWLSAIVTNSARMRLRRRPRQAALSLDERFGEDQAYALSEMFAGSWPSPEDECRKSELRACVMKLSAQLSPPLRKTFQLRDLDGLTTNEAAQIMGVPDGTVKARLARARTKLKQLMCSRKASYSKTTPAALVNLDS
jgi:RNA polymerase sigma-70 factor (ECF subfamily)